MQVSISILKPRLRHCAQVIEARRSVGVDGSSTVSACLRLSRLDLVSTARRLWLCRRPPRKTLPQAKTPCKRICLSRGVVRRAASRAMTTTRPDSVLQKLTCVVPSQYGLTLTMHSSSLLKRGSPYCAAQKGCKDMFQCTEQILRSLAANNSFASATIAEIAQNPKREYLTQ